MDILSTTNYCRPFNVAMAVKEVILFRWMNFTRSISLFMLVSAFAIIDLNLEHRLQPRGVIIKPYLSIRVEFLKSHRILAAAFSFLRAGLLGARPRASLRSVSDLYNAPIHSLSSRCNGRPLLAAQL